MMGIRLFTTVLCIAGSVLVGCKNPQYCPGNPDDDCRQMWDGAAGQCTSNEQCTAPEGVCDLGASTCVQCIAPAQTSACSGTAPVCGADDSCHACVSHDDCDSKACLPDGSCGDDSNVAYVDPLGTDNAQCTKLMACTKVSKALATGRAFVKFHGTTDEAVTLDSKNITFIADPGATLTRTSNGLLLEIRGTSQVTVFDLTISGASGPGNPGVFVPTGASPSVTLERTNLANNVGGGVSVAGGILTVSRSTISANHDGGISVTGTGTKFDITNSFIFRNGDPSASTFGGVNLGVASATGSRLEFNTIVDNQAAINSGGVICNVAGFAAANNIIARNFLAGVPGTQTMGACTYPTSVVQDNVTGLGFAHPEPPAPFDYHLTSASSAAIDLATTTSTIDTDFDGQQRPQGSQKDIGADELK